MTYMRGRNHAKYMDANVTALQVSILLVSLYSRLIFMMIVAL